MVGFQCLNPEIVRALIPPFGVEIDATSLGKSKNALSRLYFKSLCRGVLPEPAPCPNLAETIRRRVCTAQYLFCNSSPHTQGQASLSKAGLDGVW